MSDVERLPYWAVVVARSVTALGATIAITFSADHSAEFGLTVFGIYAIVLGAVLIVGARAALTPGVPRRIVIAQGIVSLLAGVIALVASWGGVALLLSLVSGWAAITGFLELYLGLRRRWGAQVAHSKDWVFTGALTALFALVMLLIPLDFSQAYTGPDNVERFLTASVIGVGMLGAYCGILGVYLVIAGLSLRWATKEPTVASTVESSN